VACAVVSALEGVKVRQDIAMTGSLSIRGAVLPVGGVTAKIEAAADTGLKRVLIPIANKVDVILEDKYTDMIEVVPVATIYDVLREATVGAGKQQLLEKLMRINEQFGRMKEAEKAPREGSKPESPPPPGPGLPGGSHVPG
jgi:Lon-like ATP-dependent protease